MKQIQPQMNITSSVFVSLRKLEQMNVFQSLHIKQSRLTIPSITPVTEET